MSDQPSSIAGGIERDERLRELEARVAELEARERAGALNAAFSTATALLRTTDASALFRLIAAKVHAIAQGAIVAITEFDPGAGKVVVRRVECPPSDYTLIAAILGRDPEGLSLDLFEEVRQRWRVGRLVRVAGGLHELLFRQVPSEVCARLERELKLGESYGMAVECEGTILGSIAVVTRARKPLSNHALVEQLVAQAALALKRIRAEEARQETEKRFRLLFDCTSDGVWINTLDGVIREVNDAYCSMSGYVRHELEGMPISRLEAAETAEDVTEHIRRLVRSGGHDRFASRHRRKDGSHFEVDITALYLEQGGGRVAIFVRDITELKRTEVALREANARLTEADRRKDELIAVLSHELRNPLAPIRYALPVLRGQHLGGQGERALSVVERQVDHLTRLVDDLLTVSRIASGKFELRLERLTLQAVVAAALEGASPALVASHELKVEVPDQPVWLQGDPARLAQVVTNLLDNSAKYTPAGGAITLRASRDGDNALISVRDTGAGMSRDALARAFDMFWQGDQRGRPTTGLGIGLALVERLVEMHGGTVEARSAGLGQGAEFVVRLPLAREASGGGEAREADVPVHPDRRLSVLIVDDNADLVEMLAIVVESAGHEALKALDGRSALSAAVSHPPHVVLLDLGLPDVSGLEVARRLRSDPATASARLVALTGWGQEEDLRQTREAGFDCHLTKPTKPRALLQLLADFARNVADVGR